MSIVFAANYLLLSLLNSWPYHTIMRCYQRATLLVISSVVANKVVLFIPACVSQLMTGDKWLQISRTICASALLLLSLCAAGAVPARPPLCGVRCWMSNRVENRRDGDVGWRGGGGGDATHRSCQWESLSGVEAVVTRAKSVVNNQLPLYVGQLSCEPG